MVLSTQVAMATWVEQLILQPPEAGVLGEVGQL